MAQTRSFPFVSLLRSKKSDLYVVRDVEIPNQLGDEGWLRSSRFLGSHCCEVG